MKKAKDKTIKDMLSIREGIQIKIDNNTNIFTVTGAKGELKKRLLCPKITAKVEGNELSFVVKKASKREKRIISTFKAHLKNMMKGCLESHNYKLKVCSAHFPMNVSVNNNQFFVKNFIGEKIPRVLDIRQGANVKVDGQEIIVDAVDKEIAGQVAADIEQLTRRPGFDRRIFMDGIYIVEKDGKPVIK